MGKLDGRVALVTGASRGIGQVIAELFGAEGAKVVCAARTVDDGEHMLEGSINRTVQAVREAVAVAADVSEPDACLALVDATREAYGPVDILVNNAALNYYVPVVDYAINRWIRAFAVNVHGPFVLSKAVLPEMVERGRPAHIVNIGSGAAIGPGSGPYEDESVRGGTMYGATKAALERFTQGLAQEVAADGNIAVSCVSPSRVVPTPGTIHHKLVTGVDDPRGEHPDVMANASLLLASEAAARINGRVTYSQLILKEFGWIEAAVGRGIESRGSGYSEI